jgi:hypothetical protein
VQFSHRRSQPHGSRLLTRLDEEKLSVIIVSKSKVLYTSKVHGIAPLIDAIDKLGVDALRGSEVADRVIGKASALLICYFEARKAFAKIMSVAGAEVLRSHAIDFLTEKSTKEIRNRNNSDICPFEKAVLQIDNPSEAYRLIKSQIRRTDSSSGRC